MTNIMQCTNMWQQVAQLYLGLAKAIGLLYLYLVGLMAIVRVSHGYGYTRGSGRIGSINNGTDINAGCVRSNSLRKLGAQWANGRETHKKLRWCAASLSLLSLAFLPPLFPSTFISTSSPGHS